MKIAVNTRLLLANRLGGIGWFTYETLIRITKNHPEHQFYFIFDRAFDEQFIFSNNIEPIVAGPPARHPILFYTWFEMAIPRVLNKIKPDLFLSPDGYLSLKTAVPSLAVIHDINFHHYPKDFPWMIKKYYNYFFPRFARKAQRIATVSEFSKSDIMKHYQIPADKIDVVYNGVNEAYAPVSEKVQEATRQEFMNGKPYFLFIGTLLPRKNIVHLLKGFDQFKQQQETPQQLLLIGNRKWWTAEMETVYNQMQHKEAVHFKSYTMPEELRRITASATALTFVPYFEGFGIPIIEAMACGIPVLTADASSTKEVAQDATLLVNPYSTDEIAKGMLRLYNDAELRNTLILKGMQRQKDFSWNATADNLYNSMIKTIEL